jgi:hypothetical protein
MKGGRVDLNLSKDRRPIGRIDLNLSQDRHQVGRLGLGGWTGLEPTDYIL